MPFLAATNALGTRVELVIDAPVSPALRAIADAALDEIHHWHDRLSKHLPHSYLSHINRAACEHPVSLDEDLFELISLADRVCRDSSRAFDPTLAGAWRDSISLCATSGTIRFLRPDITLDLGGVAKGFALDRAADILREHAVDSALLHAGTSAVVAIGDVPRRIGVRTSSGVDLVEIANTSLCVSAQRGRAHIVTDDLGASLHRTSLVIGASCAECDAWATAIVANPDALHAAPSTIHAALHDSRAWSTHNNPPFVAPSEAA
jgi:thiamine biosynthesis lipoprotein